jgi:hypothetical protein
MTFLPDIVRSIAWTRLSTFCNPPHEHRRFDGYISFVLNRHTAHTARATAGLEKLHAQ